MSLKIFQRKQSHHTISLAHLVLAVPIFLFMSLAGIWFSFFSAKLEINGIQTRALITNVEITSGENGPEYRPTFSFRDETGKNYEKRQNTATTKYYKKGEQIDVIYLRENPSKSVKIYGFGELWFIPIFILTFGIGGLVSIIFRYLNQKRAAPWIKPKEGARLKLLGMFGSSRYWHMSQQTDRIEVQYQYNQKTRKGTSQILTKKQIKKLVPGTEIQFRFDPNSPEVYIII